MGCISKVGFLTLNFFVVVLGLCVTTVSAVLLQQNSILGFLVSNLFFTLPLTTLLTGIFITCLGILGCVGALKEHPILLKIYASVVMLLLLLVLTAGVLMIVFTSNISKFLVNSMNDVFNQYGDEEREYITRDLDWIQNTLHCCGVLDYTDWENYSYGNGTNVADGCCRNQTEGCGIGMLQEPYVGDLIYTTGCVGFVAGAFGVVSFTLGIVTLILVGIQALSITWACIIAKDSRRGKYKRFINEKNEDTPIRKY